MKNDELDFGAAQNGFKMSSWLEECRAVVLTKDLTVGRTKKNGELRINYTNMLIKIGV